MPFNVQKNLRGASGILAATAGLSLPTSASAAPPSPPANTAHTTGTVFSNSEPKKYYEIDPSYRDDIEKTRRYYSLSDVNSSDVLLAHAGPKGDVTIDLNPGEHHLSSIGNSLVIVQGNGFHMVDIAGDWNTVIGNRGGNSIITSINNLVGEYKLSGPGNDLTVKGKGHNTIYLFSGADVTITGFDPSRGDAICLENEIMTSEFAMNSKFKPKPFVSVDASAVKNGAEVMLTVNAEGHQSKIHIKEFGENNVRDIILMNAPEAQDFIPLGSTTRINPFKRVPIDYVPEAGATLGDPHLVVEALHSGNGLHVSRLSEKSVQYSSSEKISVAR